MTTPEDETGAATIADHKLLTIHEVMELVNMGQSTIYRARKLGTFPSGFYLFGHSGRLRWTLKEILEWKKQRER